MTAALRAEHADLMDRVYQNQRHFYDLTRKYYLLGRDRLVSELDPPPRARILEIGCGTGRNLIAIAAKYPASQCFGLDISAHMLRTASNSIRRKGLGERVRVCQGDATRFATEGVFAPARFDRVVISYALSMIPGWAQALRQAIESVAPGGSLHIVDFGQQGELPNWFRWGLRRWLKMFHVTPNPDLPAELDLVATAENLGVSTSSLYGGYALYTILRRV